jgi:hypothetical protein
MALRIYGRNHDFGDRQPYHGHRPVRRARRGRRPWAWIVSTHSARLFTLSQAITALTLAGRLAIGYGDDGPFVMAWPKELFL